MTTLTELAWRLEQATGAEDIKTSRELDFAIANALNIKIRYTAPHYTSSLDAAVALAEKVLPNCTSIRIGIHMFEKGRHDADIEFKDKARGATPALALCLAIIRALIEKEKK